MKIKLHFDDIIYQLQGQGGISTYWTEITSRIYMSSFFEINRTKGRKKTRYFPIGTNADIFQSSYYRIPISKSVKNVVTIHDFLYDFGYIKTLNASINIFQTRLAINKADAIVCVSENTKKDLLQLYPKLINHSGIYIVGHGTSFKLNDSLNQQPPVRLLQTSQPMLDKYILFVGKRIKYKNFINALLGFFESSLPKYGFSMICVGSQFTEAEVQLIKKLDLHNNISVFENATNNELNYLYQNSFALVYPSLYEGFGLPPLEAMSCGCPVIASNSSSIPEVVGNAGILINPYETKEIASALESLLSQQVRNSYIAKGFARAKLFNWEEASQKYIEIYQSVVNSYK